MVIERTQSDDSAKKYHRVISCVLGVFSHIEATVGLHSVVQILSIEEPCYLC